MNAQLQRQKPQTAQTGKPNLTGIPTQMKLDFERRSGLPFDDVRVHYNSEKPAQLGALAYTRGTQIHVGPGQERHLPHELGHVIQQKLGVVRPTCIINGVPIAESPSLERGADIAAGSQATSFSSPPRETSPVIQRKGAVPLAKLLALNGYPMDDTIISINPELKAAIQAYDTLPWVEEPVVLAQLDQLTKIKELLQNEDMLKAIKESSFAQDLTDKRYHVICEIIESEIAAVKYQLRENPMVQREGAVPLAELLARNDCSMLTINLISSELKAAIQAYDTLPQAAEHVVRALNTELEQLAAIKKLLPAAPEDPLSTEDLQDAGNYVLRKIIESEIIVVEKQLAKWSPRSGGSLAVYTNELAALEKEETRIEQATKNHPKGLMGPWGSHSSNIGAAIKVYRRLIKEIQGGSARRNVPTQQRDPYKVMDDEGSEWRKDSYRSLISGEHGKIEQLSKAHNKNIKSAVLVQGNNSIPFSKITDYDPFHKKLANILLEQTTLAHYSFHTDIPTLLAKDYAQASGIDLTTDNSAKGKEDDLKNTGFVFFFLEQKGRAPRINSRFGTTRYTIPTKYAAARGILTRSWAMLVDFHTAYDDFMESGVKIFEDKKIIFKKDYSLSGTMTYRPSGATLKVEPFHNILKGDDIISGLSQFAAQQLYALFNTDCDLELSFEQVGLTDMDDRQLLNMVLKMFRLQIMVPYAVVPMKTTLITGPSTPKASSPPAPTGS